MEVQKRITVGWLTPAHSAVSATVALRIRLGSASTTSQTLRSDLRSSLRLMRATSRMFSLPLIGLDSRGFGGIEALVAVRTIDIQLPFVPYGHAACNRLRQVGR